MYKMLDNFRLESRFYTAPDLPIFIEKEVHFGDCIEIIKVVNQWVIYLGLPCDMGKDILESLNRSPTEPMVAHVTKKSLRSGEILVEPLSELIKDHKFRINNSRDKFNQLRTQEDAQKYIASQINGLDPFFKSYIHNSEHFVNKVRINESYSRRSENAKDNVESAATAVGVIGVVAGIVGVAFSLFKRN